MKWKKYLLISISAGVLIFSKQIVRACAGMYYEFYSSTVFFGNETPEKPAYTPFYYTEHDVYYGEDLYWRNESASDKVNKNIILKEWVDYFDGKFSKQAIEGLLYHKGDENIFQKIKNDDPISIKNAFSIYLQQQRSSSVLDYLIYAKYCEINANQEAQAWPEEKTKPAKSNRALKAEGLAAIKNIHDPFLRMKYTFQILRMAFYNQNYTGVLELYTQLIGKEKDGSVAFTRNLGFKAGAYYHLDQRIKAGYFYTKMFANSDAYKLPALKSFQWAISKYTQNGTKDHFSSVYQLSKNDKERAVALEMKLLHTPSLALKGVKKIYGLYPKIEGFGVLINREVNKLEYLYFAEKIKIKNRVIWDTPNEKKSELKALNEVYLPYINKFEAFLDQLIMEEKIGSRSFWYLTKAYLASMQHKPIKIQQNLANAKKAGMSDREKALYERISLLHILYKSPKITSQTEATLLPKLQHLEQLAMQKKDKNFAKQQLEDLMSHIVAKKYLRQGDTIKGVYALAHSYLSYNYKTKGKRFYVSHGFRDLPGEILNRVSIKTLKKVIHFRENTPKSDFEKWLVESTYYTADVLKELLATKYIRQQKFRAAAAVLATTSISDDFTDPFMPQINDYLHPRNNGPRFTKLEYSERMAELKRIIQKNPDDAGALYGYAIALYNTSYYGQAWQLTAYHRSSTESKAYYKREWIDKELPDFRLDYYRAYKAEHYFLKTYKAAKSPELQAKALWGAAKCWQKRAPLTTEDLDDYEIKYDYISNWNHEDEYFQHSLNNPYFSKLEAHYLHTDFVQKARMTCDYFEDYL